MLSATEIIARNSENVGVNVGANVGANVGVNDVEKKIIEELLKNPF